MFEDWQWMAVALIAVTFAGTMRSLIMLWASLAATAVGALVWSDASFPILYQLLIFGGITLGGYAITHLFIKPQPEGEGRDEEPPIKAPNPRRVVNKIFTLTEPLVPVTGHISLGKP